MIFISRLYCWFNFISSDFIRSLKCISSKFAAEKACFFRCHNNCYNTPGCNWYTSYGEGAICNLYADCDSIDDSFCSTCVTGEASCPICGLEGICEGTAIHFEVVISEIECEVNTVVSGCSCNETFRKLAPFTRLLYYCITKHCWGNVL